MPDLTRTFPRQGNVDPLCRGLLRLARHRGKTLSLAEIHGVWSPSGQAMTVADFQATADRLGLQGILLALDASTLATLPVPFIIVFPDARAPVLVEARQGEILDARTLDRDAPLSLPCQGLAADGASVLLLRDPLENPAPRHRRLLSRFHGVFWELAAASLFINLFTLGTPLFMMTVYNKVVAQSALATLDVLAIALLTVYLFDTALRLIRGYVSSHAGARLEALLGSEVSRHLLGLPYRHFATTTSGLITERLRQLEVIRHFFTGQMPLVVADLLFVVVFVGALLVIAPPLAGITLVAMPLLVGLSLVFRRRQQALDEQYFTSQAARLSTLNETLHNVLTVKSLGLEPELERRWDHRLGLCAWHGFRAGHLGHILTTLGGAVQQLSVLAIIYVGARLIVHGELSIGALIAANILATRALTPMRQLTGAWQQVQAVRAAFARLDAILDEPLEPTTGALATPPRGAIQLEAVGFRYRDAGAPVLEGLDLRIQAGEVLGIIGASGSGKSTVARLLQGLYEPTAGRILVDGSDIRHLCPAVWRRQLGVVPQEIQLFAGSVGDNIALGSPDRDPARVVGAARLVGAHEFIQNLPQGYDTVLGEGGVGLSNGQRQLIAIARALMRNPRVLILDEATSALDPSTEEQLLQRLCRTRRDRTLIMISHRLAPLLLADRIALMAAGRVAQVGPPREIIARFHPTTAAAHGPVSNPEEAAS